MSAHELTAEDHKVLRRTQRMLRQRIQEDDENLDDVETVCLSIGYVDVSVDGYTAHNEFYDVEYDD